jgi:hypothetical protein
MPPRPYLPAHLDYVLTLAPGSVSVTGSGRVTSLTAAPDGSVSVKLSTPSGATRYRRFPAHRLIPHPLSAHYNGTDTCDDHS